MQLNYFMMPKTVYLIIYFNQFNLLILIKCVNFYSKNTVYFIIIIYFYYVSECGLYINTLPDTVQHIKFGFFPSTFIFLLFTFCYY